ncbi:MAG: hypothetical protein PHR44_05565 [Candidatus Omnitrophica bacterium]|nr:hypothetical protein [Candidatus Omnitrophota bacterium]
MKTGEFIGRQEIKDILGKRLQGFREGYRQNIAVLGSELVGKSSAVLDFFGRFQDNAVVPVYLEVKPDEDLQSFLKRFFCAMLYSFLQNSGISLQNDYGFLVNASRRFIPDTAGRIAVLAEVAKAGSRASGVFFEMLSILDVFYKETSKSCVVVFDEFQNIENFKVKNLYREWGKAICVQKNIMYILISSRGKKAQKILQEDLSLLFGNFEIIELAPFDARCSNEMINRHFAPFFIDHNFRKFLIYFTGGHPFYLKTICESMTSCARGHEKNIIDSEVFVEGIVRSLSDRWSVLNKNFLFRTRQLADTASSRDRLKILAFITDGCNRIKDIRLNLRRQKNKIVDELDALIAGDVLTRSGDFYTFNDRLYNLWFKFVYSDYASGNPLMGEEFITRLKARITDEVKSFIENNNKDILERMTELFYNFNDESVVIERKRLKLSHFREIKPLKFSGSRVRDGILGRSSDIVWVAAFNGQDGACLTYEDIMEFAGGCKKFRSKARKKFIIVSEDIDANARLLAKEEKIMTWNLDNLNLLMDFYGKPRIIK